MLCTFIIHEPFWLKLEPTNTRVVLLLEAFERVAFMDGSGVVKLESPSTWAVKEEEHAHGVTIACATRSSTPQVALRYHRGPC